MSCGGEKGITYTVYQWECTNGHVYWQNKGVSHVVVPCNVCSAPSRATGKKETYPLCVDRDAPVTMPMHQLNREERTKQILLGMQNDPNRNHIGGGTLTPKDGGEQKATYNQDPEKGGIKQDAGKTEWSILPFEALEEVVHVFMKGRDKYTRNNWRKGMSWSRVMDSTMRHLYAWYWRKEDKDPESGHSHLAHAVANLMFLLTYEKLYKEGDDR